MLLVWFTTEVVLRLMRHKWEFFTNDDWHWNIFDFCIVSTGVADSWVMPVVLAFAGRVRNTSFSSIITIFRVARLLRVLRVARLFRVFRQLNLLIGGLIEAAQAVIWITMLSGILVYVNAVVCTKLIGDREPGNFDSMVNSCWTLFNVMCSAGLPATVSIHVDNNSWKVYFGGYTIASAWTMVNLVTAVLSEHMVSATSEQYRADEAVERVLRFREDRQAYTSLCSDMFHKMDNDRDGLISEADLHAMLASDTADPDNSWEPLVALAGFGVVLGEEEVKAYFFMIDIHGRGVVNREEFISGMLRLRGEADAKHLFMLQWELQSLKEDLVEIVDLNMGHHSLTAKASPSPLMNGGGAVNGHRPMNGWGDSVGLGVLQ